MILFLVMVFLVAGVCVFAEDITPTQVKTTLTNLQEAFTGTAAQVILGICFAGSCIAYAYNKDNEKMKAKVLAVMIATGLLVLSSTIVETFWKIKSNS